MKKDKEWLIKRVENYIPLNDKTVGHVVDDILDIIRQLDEPEVLSQEWIDEHKYFAEKTIGEDAVVKARDLRNLIVLKQEEMVNYTKGWIDGIAAYVEDLNSGENLAVIEKPIIPDFVANYIKWFKNDFEHNFAADIDFIISLIQVSHKFSRREKIKNWISKSGNAQKLLDAYRWGYEVEEEQKYFVLDKDELPLLIKLASNSYVIRTNTYYAIKETNDSKFYQLTEQEIKDYDERFWTFAVPVEEMEE